jgi:segregation and condensation protein B
MVNQKLKTVIEAILFSTHESLSVTQLAHMTEADPNEINIALNELQSSLIGGIRLAKAEGAYRLVSAPEAAEIVRKFHQDSSRQELSRPALETLSIVAYRGPLTRSQIEAIRGVSSESMIRNLLSRGLVIESGRSPEPGKPQLYAISHAFLAHFGLTSTSDLPPLPETEHED